VQGFPSSHWAAVVQGAQPWIGVWPQVPVARGALSDAIQAGPPLRVPSCAGFVESPAVGPAFSSSPQRPRRSFPDVTSWSIPDWISAGLRARFQTRTSSMVPPKKPSVTPSEFIAVPSPKCWMLSDRGSTPGFRGQEPAGLQVVQAVASAAVPSIPSR
jgi:hypothetical protein